jgi:hemolysin activation/secretion protein
MRKLWLAAVTAAFPVLVHAQNVGNGINSQISPSAPNYQQPSAAPPPPTYELPPLPNPLSEPAPAATGGGMFVKHIEVRGVKAFKPAVIDAIVKPYENRMVSSAELQSLRVGLTRLYIDKGYVNSGVLLPDQQSTDGVVVYQAVEGTLSRIEVSGPTKLSANYVSARIRSYVDTPLNISDLQYALRYLQEDPNVLRLDAKLAPGDALGQSTLRLNVEEQPRFTAGIGGDNYHSPTIGEWEGTVTLGARDLTGYGDEWRGTVLRAAGDTEGSGVFSIPVNALNASFQAYFSYAKAGIIEQPFEPLNIDETTRTYGLQFTAPLVDRLNNRFAVFAGVESDHSYTTLLGEPFSFSPGAQNGVSNVAVALAGIDWLLRGSSSVTDLRVTYRRGFSALGATVDNGNGAPYGPDANPTGADALFGLEQLQFIFIQRLNGIPALSKLNDRAQLIARATGQISQDPLLVLEKFTIGGIDTVRGVPVNLLVRDNGAAATIELQLPIPGYRSEPNPRDLVVAAFVDYGRSWDKVNTAIGNPDLNTTNALNIATAGIGLLWNPLRGLDAKAYWGKSIANNFNAYDNPLTYAPNDLQKDGYYLSLNYVAHW